MCFMLEMEKLRKELKCFKVKTIASVYNWVELGFDKSVMDCKYNCKPKHKPSIFLVTLKSHD